LPAAFGTGLQLSVFFRTGLQKGDSTPSIFRSDTSWFVQVELHIAVPKVTLTYNNAPPLLLCPYHSDFHVLHHKRLADFVNPMFVVCAPKSLRLSHWETNETFPEEDGHLLRVKPRLWTKPISRYFSYIMLYIYISH
jgi:hypothetical protein